MGDGGRLPRRSGQMEISRRSYEGLWPELSLLSLLVRRACRVRCRIVRTSADN
jgi:hypothetical protein